MGRPRKPLALKTGAMTRDEYFKRKAEEFPALDQAVVIPDGLDEKEAMHFKAYAVLLSELGVYSVLDTEELARYVRNQAMFERYSDEAKAASCAEEAKPAQQLANQAFDRAHKSASALCLNITGRLKVPNPKKEERKDDVLPAC